MRRALAWALILGIGTLLGVVVGGIPDRGKDPPLEIVSDATTSTPSSLVAAPASTVPQLRPPSEVKVITVNASGLAGRAAAMNRALAAAEYAVIQPGVNARKDPVSAVYWTSGYEADARALAGTLGFPADAARSLPDPPPVANLGGAALVVVIGQDRAR